MATIKERAKDAVHKQYDCDCPCYGIDVCKFGNGDENAYSCGDCGADEFEQGYLKGATEQRQLDIEKACRLVKETIEDYAARYCETWSEECRKSTFENIRNAMLKED